MKAIFKIALLIIIVSNAYAQSDPIYNTVRLKKTVGSKPAGTIGYNPMSGEWEMVDGSGVFNPKSVLPTDVVRTGQSNVMAGHTSVYPSTDGVFQLSLGLTTNRLSFFEMNTKFGYSLNALSTASADISAGGATLTLSPGFFSLLDAGGNGWYRSGLSNFRIGNFTNFNLDIDGASGHVIVNNENITDNFGIDYTYDPTASTNFGDLSVPTKKYVDDAVAGGGGSPPGSDTQAIFNDGGSYGADAGFTYNKSTDLVTSRFQGVATGSLTGFNPGIVAGGISGANTGDMWFNSSLGGDGTMGWKNGFTIAYALNSWGLATVGRIPYYTVASQTVGDSPDLTFDGIYINTNNAAVRVGGSFMDSFTDANNSGTGETDLHSYTTPANFLNHDHDKIEFEYVGSFNDVTSSAELKVYFDGSQIIDTGIIPVSTAGTWTAKGTIIRTGTTTARAYATVTLPFTTVAGQSFNAWIDLSSISLTNTSILKITGQASGGGGGSNDITLRMANGKWLPGN